MKVALYCKCGASATGTIKPDTRAHRFIEVFWNGHSGEGHAPCDQKTAAAARRKQDRKAASEVPE